MCEWNGVAVLAVHAVAVLLTRTTGFVPPACLTFANRSDATFFASPAVSEEEAAFTLSISSLAFTFSSSSLDRTLSKKSLAFAFTSSADSSNEGVGAAPPPGVAPAAVGPTFLRAPPFCRRLSKAVLALSLASLNDDGIESVEIGDVPSGEASVPFVIAG